MLAVWELVGSVGDDTVPFFKPLSAAAGLFRNFCLGRPLRYRMGQRQAFAPYGAFGPAFGKKVRYDFKCGSDLFHLPHPLL